MTDTQRDRDRGRTERLLEESALRILSRDGVLSGLNLREVADGAGVNRGLVYHYFGSRQELLRSALRRRMLLRLAASQALDEPDFEERMAKRFRSVIEHQEAIMLMTLLWLDNDEHIRVIPSKDRTVAELRDQMHLGTIAEGISPSALQAALNALTVGYALFREAYSAELGIPLEELDRAIELARIRLIKGTL